jgi:DNA-binding transcriptional regulator YiaG
MQRKVVKRYIDHGFGFPVILHHVPMIKALGQWTPDINYKQLERSVLLALVNKPSRFTGSEVRFIRHYFKLTLQAFGERFDVRHSAVIKWEKAQDAPTRMEWSTEKDIRLFTMDQLLPEKELAKKIVTLYRELNQKRNDEPVPLEQDCQELLAHCG